MSRDFSRGSQGGLKSALNAGVEPRIEILEARLTTY